MKDWRGKDIKPGSIIVYPGRQSSHMWMIEARVIKEVMIDHYGTETPALLVQPIKQGFYGRTNMKPVRLTAFERITVIDECKKEPIIVSQYVGIANDVDFEENLLGGVPGHA